MKSKKKKHYFHSRPWSQLKSVWIRLDSAILFCSQWIRGWQTHLLSSDCTWTLHLTNGSPTAPFSHSQMAMWSTTEHLALSPQAFAHGSTHFRFMQAKFRAQSEFTLHSGRQYGGIPLNSGKHEHDGLPLSGRHLELGPQGLGTQGLTCSTSWAGGGAASFFWVILSS